MRGLSRKERQLSQALLDLHEEAMLIDELDGFLTGLLVCPEMIPPSVWLKRVWHRHGGDDAAFRDIDHLNKVIGLVMDHYNRIATTLFQDPTAYAPLFAIDKSNGDVLWEIWVEGFETAVKLRPMAWEPVLSADIEAARAWSGLMMLADVTREDRRFSKVEIDALTATAHERIPEWVLVLNAWRLASQMRAPGFAGNGDNRAARPERRVGRNEPCPCGSGKKYKKCCGLN